MKRGRLIITIGDPAGIGPEIVVKALCRKEAYEGCIPVVMGDCAVLEDAVGLTGAPLALRRLASPEDAQGQPGTLEYIDAGLIERGSYALGQVSAACGEAAFQYIVRAIDYAMSGQALGVVTGPICKEALHLAGHHYSGHTEIFAERTGCKDYAMLLTSGNLRVIHCTTHVSLRNACDLITPARVSRTILLARDALRMLGLPNGTIGVAGLNPHCSENGLFGDEERTGIIPAIEACQAQGIKVEGPVPPDTVFVKAAAGQYDLVVAMYHDQGHIPLKLAGFRLDAGSGRFTSLSGVNTTVGLPIIRTSVDHGTAFDKAGRGIANEQSLLEALALAVQMIPYYQERCQC